MQPYVEAAVDRLNSQLPLLARQRSAGPELAALHRAILRSLFETGGVGALARDERIGRLAEADLVVRSKTTGELAGAYPMTTEPTPHRLAFGDRSVNAMCAVDALSVTAIFGGSVEIRSKCRVTRNPIVIRQNGMHIEHAEPATVLVGVRWGMPSGHAAHSMCMEMVFLESETVAEQWHGGDLSNHTLFPLRDAVEFGAAFFGPLVAGDAEAAGAR